MIKQNVIKGEEIALERLSIFMAENGLVKNGQSILEVNQFSNGYSNLTYEIITDSRKFVLRLPPKGAVKHGHDMGREYKVLSGLQQAFTKAPKPFSFSEDDSILGRPFYLMERIEGHIITLPEAKRLQLTAADFAQISSTWLDTLTELHQIDYEAIGLGQLGRPQKYIERQVVGWSTRYLKAKTSEIPEAIKVMNWMQDNQPQEVKHTIIHNDFKYDNVVFQDDSWTNINAILDWEMCTLGDPLMDLGTSLAYWTTADDPPPILQGLPSPTILEGNPSRLQIAEQYAQKSGLQIDHLTFYYVYGLFKIAVIAQQIYYRYAKGMTTNEKFKNLDKSCQFLCMMAHQAIQKNRIEKLF